MKRLAQKTATAILVLAALPALSTGCRPDFAPFNRLTSLRVLAIQSEPAAPAPGETATLSALVYVPPTDSNLRYSWDWCPFPGAQEDGYPCLVTEEEAVMAGAQGYHLGDGPTAMLANSVAPMTLAAFCQGAPGLPQAPNCAGGFPAQIRLTVTTDSEGLGTDTVVSVVTHRWRFPDPQTTELQSPNSNPTIDGLTATVDGATLPVTELPDAVTLPRDVATTVNATIDPGASEEYRGPDDNGVLATLQERLFVTWFVETGDTDDTRTSFISGRTSFDALGTNKWSPGLIKDFPATTARIFAVLHDNRGGVGWRGGAVQLGPKP